MRSTLPAGFIPDAVATGDFNRDGKTDWVVANGGDNDLWVYLSNGDGTTAPPTILNLSGLGPVSVTTADLRRNGKVDIIVAEVDSNSVEVFLGNGDGTFQSPDLYELSGQPTYVVVADFNRDGRPDLAVAMLGQSPVVVLPANGNGTFGGQIPFTWGDGEPELVSLSVSDVNGDGNPDLVFVDVSSFGGVALLIGNGDGTFTLGPLIAENFGGDLVYLAAAAGDVNEDGCPDIVATDNFAFALTYLGNCDGTFSSTPSYFGIGDIGVSVALEDIDGDGHLDIVAGGDYVGNMFGAGDDAGNLLCVLKGDGTGNFATANVFRSQPGMYSLAFVQLSGATVPSILAVNEDTDALTLFKNDGTGDFGPPRGRAIGYSGGVSNAPYGTFVVADVNGDHLPDLLNIDVPQYSTGTFQLSTILNQGNGHFAPAALSPLYSYSMSPPGDMAVGDFRNTGHLDVVVIGQNTNFYPSSAFIAFAANQGNGTFAPATVMTSPTASGVIGVGDFNRDGKLDFVTLSGAQDGQQAFNVFLGNGDGTFAAQPSVEWGGTHDRWPIQVYVGDFNSDGKLDVIVHLYENVVPYSVNDLYVFYGNGDGTFQQPLRLIDNLDAMTLADLNHNGVPDLVTCKFPDSDYPAQGTPASTSVLLGRRAGGYGPATVYDAYSEYSLLTDQIGIEPGSHSYCPVADFNGDGNLDIGVNQSETQYAAYPAFVQFLSGNGDGTFTPTYNIYSFDRPTLPQGFYDLDLDGKADVLELDGLTSSFNVIPGAAAKQFQLETATEPITGNTGSAQVSLNVPSSSDTVITLQGSDPGLQVPGSVAIPAGSISQQFTYTVTSQANVHQVFKITATLGNEQEVAYNFVLTDRRVLTGFDFGLQYSTAYVYPGLSSTDYQPSYRASVNYETTLTPSCSGLPAGLSCNFQPASIPLSQGNYIVGSLIVNAASDVAPGTYNFQVTASDSNSSVSVPASLTVYPPTPMLNVTAPSRTDGQVGAPSQITFTIKNLGDEPAHNTVTTLSYDPPQLGELQLTGLTASRGSCSVSSQSCSLGTVNVGDVITVTATLVPNTSGDLEFGLSASDSDNSSPSGIGIDIIVADYSISLSTDSLTVNPGSQGNANVTLQAVGGQFTLPITLSCSGLPTGATCEFNPSTVTLGSSPVASMLTISIPQNSGSLAPAPASRRARPLLALWLAPFAVVAMPFARRKVSRWLSLLAFALVIGLVLQACGGGGGATSSGSSNPGGGGGGTTPPPAPSTYHVNITAGSSGNQHSRSLTLTVP